MEAFATMQLIAYSIFLIFTYTFRNTLLPPAMAGTPDLESGLPPAQPAYSGETGYAANGGGFTDVSSGGAPSGGVL